MKKVFFISLMFAFFLSSYSQDLLILDVFKSEKKSYKLEEIQADTNLRCLPELLSFNTENQDLISIDFYLHIQLFKVNSEKYKLKVWMDSLKTTNAFYYKNYSLNQFVFPKKVHFSIRLRDQNSPVNCVLETTTDFQRSSHILLAKEIADSSKMAFYRISSLDLQLIYEQDLDTKLKQSLQWIDEVSSLSPKLLAIEKKLQDLEQVRAGVVKLYNIDLKDIEQKIADIEGLLFSSDFANTTMPSQGVFGKFQDLKEKTMLLRKQYDKMMLYPEYEFFNDGYYALVDHNVDLAIANFQKSIQQKSDYAPPYFYLAKIALDRQQYDSCANTITKIFSLKPDFTTLQKTNQLANRLQKEIASQAYKLRSDHKTNEAIKILEIGQKFCVDNPSLGCSDAIKKEMIASKTVLMDSWISITKAALSANNYKLAYNYWQWTYKYFKDNKSNVDASRFHTVDSLGKAMVSTLLNQAEMAWENQQNAKLTTYITQLEIMDFKDAILVNRFQALKGKYRKTDQIVVASRNAMENREVQVVALDHIAPKFKSKDFGENAYYNNIQSALKSISIEEYEQADIFLQMAEKVEQDNKWDSLNILHASVRKAMTLQKIKKCSGQISQSKESLQKCYAEQLSYAQEYDLEEDSEIKGALRKLKFEITDMECLDYSKSYLRNMSIGNRSLLLKDYLSAAYYWKEAEIISSQNPKCLLDSITPKEKLHKIEVILVYENMWREAEKHLHDGNYEIGLEMYLQSENYYKEKELTAKGILPHTLNYYLSENGTIRKLQISALQYFVFNDMADQAWEQVLGCFKKNYINLSEDFTKQLIAQIAKMDYSKDIKVGNTATKSSRLSRITDKKVRRLYLRGYK